MYVAHVALSATIPSMPNWIVQLWHRIRGNIEATIVLTLLGVAMTVFTILTHGLSWWQQALLIVLVWAIYATLSRRKVISPGTSPQRRVELPPPPPDVTFPDKIRMFCKDLSAYVSNRMARPDETEIWNKYGSDSSPISSPRLFAEKYNDTVQLWDDRIAAGYWLSFADRAAALRHELVLRTRADDELDKLLQNLEGPSKGKHHIWMQQLVERFRLLASRLD
jgi:hypothetical protein